MAQVRDLVSVLVSQSSDTRNEVYIMSEDKTTLIPVNCLSIFQDDNNRIIIIPTDRANWGVMAVKID